MMYWRKFIWLMVFLFVQNVSLWSQNVMITNSNNPNEPSIMLDPKKPGVMVAGTNLNNYHISSDTGRTWQTFNLKSTYGVWGDPSIVVDTNSAFYFFHLSNPSTGTWIDRIVCQKSIDSGKTWTDGTYTGLNGTKKQDKQWCVVDRKTNNLYMTWTQFDKYASTTTTDSSIILFSKSTNGGSTWSTPLRINKVAGDCLDDDKTVEGATPAVGVNGEIYSCWAGPSGLVLNKSVDQGNTWQASETFIDSIPGGWNFTVPGINRCNGLPIITCDLSNSSNRGALYVNWSDQRNGSNNTDIWLRKSIDGGKTWLPRVKVNNDSGQRHQFFTWMSIDQTNGNLYFVFYDRRHLNTDSTDVYLAVSRDGGNTFINQKISESPFFPISSIFFGDYTNITAYNGIVRPIWTRLNAGVLSLWTNLTNDKNITGIPTASVASTKITAFENYPNPSSNEVFVSYKLHEISKVTLELLDASGNLINEVFSNKEMGYGKYIERIDLNKFQIAPGNYFLCLRVNGHVNIRRQIVVN